MTGMAIGAAGSGIRPIGDWRQVTFCFVAMDQIVNQAAKIHYMFGGQAKFPILFRAAVGGGTQLAAQHSQSPYSMFMNLAGLKMILPSTPADMKGLLKSAIRDNNPVISFESSRLMTMRGEVPEDDYTIPLGVADVKRQGSDCTVVAFAWMVHEALAAAETLAQENISVEVVDPRTLVPMDRGTIRASVRKTGRLVVADEAGPTCGASAEICALVTEDRADLPRAEGAGAPRVCAGGADPLHAGARIPRLPEPRPHRRRGARGGDGRVTQAQAARLVFAPQPVLVKCRSLPSRGALWDDDLSGFGLRIKPSGATHSHAGEAGSELAGGQAARDWCFA